MTVPWRHREPASLWLSHEPWPQGAGGGGSGKTRTCKRTRPCTRCPFFARPRHALARLDWCLRRYSRCEHCTAWCWFQALRVPPREAPVGRRFHTIPTPSLVGGCHSCCLRSGALPLAEPGPLSRLYPPRAPGALADWWCSARFWRRCRVRDVTGTPR